MAASKPLKSTDRQNVIKKLLTELKKTYKGKPTSTDHSVMESLIFAACLENSSFEAAEAAFQRLLDGFFDLNEIRVSSVDEIKLFLDDLPEADWKAFRIREALHHVFETQFSFDMEALKRKTLDAASKELNAIAHQTSFIKNYVLQGSCSAHIIPVDQSMLAALVWLGVTQSDSTIDQAADELKGATKKADAPYICYLLKSLAVDERLAPAFQMIDDETDLSPDNAHKRLADLIKNGPPKPSKKAAVKKAPAKQAAKPVKKAAKEATKTVTKKKPVKKTTKPSSAKVTGKKTTTKVTKKVTKKKPAKKATKSTRRR
ncbi:MAG: hypothetical protein KDA90_01850 [Planctomycetaceae bacterium]|nr:hypothetical protein [Planctomycetaceae bacterium]MCB1647629.1 hypothetical protein [Pseudomonadales bacterium]